MKGFLKCLVLITIIAIFSCIVSAADFSVEIASYTKTSITTSEYANFVLSIKNNLDVNQTIRVIPNDPSWIVDTVPKSDYLFVLSGNGERFLYLTVKPKISANLDINMNYIVDLNLFSETTQEEQNAMLNVRLQDSETRRRVQLARCISVVPIYPSGIVDPREKIMVSTNFSESTCDNFNNVTVTVVSEIINGQSIPNTEMEFSISPQTLPGIYPVVMSIMQGDFEVRKPTFAIKIMPYQDVEKTTKEIQSSLFGIITTKEITFENKGNVDVPNYQYKVKRGLSDVFNSYDPKSDVIELNDGNYYVWNFNIPINHSKTLIVKSNYTVLAILIVIAVLLLIYAILTRPKVEVIKKVTNMGTSGQGLSRFKVMVVVRNITNNNLNNIKINDKVPHIAMLVPSDYLGTVKPSKVLKHPQKGTIVIWDIDELHPKEERILYYVMESRMNIIGSFNLPSAAVKMKDMFGRMVKVTSNRATAHERRATHRVLEDRR
jgi:hypothetical protein